MGYRRLCTRKQIFYVYSGLARISYVFRLALLLRSHAAVSIAKIRPKAILLVLMPLCRIPGETTEERSGPDSLNGVKNFEESKCASQLIFQIISDVLAK